MVKKEIKRMKKEYQPGGVKGWISVYRGLLDHPIFDDEPFTTREVFIWMIAEAAFTDRSKLINSNGKDVYLKRGQFSHSIIYMAAAFGWGKSRTYRWLKKFEKNGMINTNTETGQTVVTICNYDKFQQSNVASETGKRTVVERYRKLSEFNNNNGNNIDNFNKWRAEHVNDDGAITSGEFAWKRELQRLLPEIAYFLFIEPLSIDEDGFIIAPKYVLDFCKSNYEIQFKKAFLETGYVYRGFREESAKLNL